MIGKTFSAELAAAGLTGLPFSWGTDGSFFFSPELSQEQRDAVLAVYAAHNPNLVTEQDYVQALEGYYDQVARAKQYDNRLTCALRAGLAGSPFQAEGQAFGVWMDTCNAYGYQQLSLVKTGQRAAPTIEEFLAELPAAPW